MLKRFLDIVIASIALILLSPLYAFVAYKVKKNLGSPVLFRQVRPGLNGKPFEMIKFRTMKDAVDAQGNPLPDSERLTPFGKMLRATSLDEMPELWNVIKGDMSVVGPRPHLPSEAACARQGWAPRRPRRHPVPPARFPADRPW